MVEVMEKWQRPKLAHKHDHFLLVLDFLRHFFLNACEPSTEIQQYACRQSGKKEKFDYLKDLPKGLVDFLISFILDALGLHRDQLLRTPDEHKRNPNKLKIALFEKQGKFINEKAFKKDVKESIIDD
ncbi:unnamed protein product [Cylicocyclus nassatus]|uniref:Uncharacterized protein n=1 Tax=Cylicocyclus nassatus TaxID=53992 RepID=A0AA36DRU5_CYLNA|nr:unnamed protein product [Cylicocyclus nassatus]